MYHKLAWIEYTNDNFDTAQHIMHELQRLHAESPISNIQFVPRPGGMYVYYTQREVIQIRAPTTKHTVFDQTVDRLETVVAASSQESTT